MNTLDLPIKNNLEDIKNAALNFSNWSKDKSMEELNIKGTSSTHEIYGKSLAYSRKYIFQQFFNNLS